MWWLILEVLNDMWRYAISTNTWEHLFGNQRIETLSNYSVPYPGGLSRHVMRAVNDKLYVYGGNGYGDASVLGSLSALWCYSISSNTWMLLRNNTKGLLSNFTVPFPGTVNGHTMRYYNNSLYTFGGEGYGEQYFGIILCYSD